MDCKSEKKVTIKEYVCKKCNKYIYIRPDEDFDGICQCCKQPVDFLDERVYNPKGGLEAIKTAKDFFENDKRKVSVPRIECPYCHSTNTIKISATSKVLNTALFGILGTKRYKQWHCNDCKSDF